jgi:light-regulated signal transduction histidine kinase (bacteriophytochrome)
MTDRTCASDPDHTPAAIQLHGALLAVTMRGLDICYAGKTVGTFRREVPQNLLGKSIPEVFGRKATHDLSSGARRLEASEKAIDLGVIEFSDMPLSVTVSAS